MGYARGIGGRASGRRLVYGAALNLPPPFTGPTYVGAVASRGSVVPTSLLAGAGTSYMSRKFFDATENIRDIQLLLPNFAVTGNGTAESLSGGILTCSEAWVEYPAGQFQPIAFGGGNSTAGSWLASDRTSLARYVPKGQRAWIVFALSNTVAMPISTVTTPGYGTPQYVAGGDATQVGGSDHTNVVDDGTNNTVWPLAILGTTQNPTFALVGDSRQVLESSPGPVYSLSDATGRVGEALRALGGAYGVLNLAIPGDQAARAVPNYAIRRLLALQYATHAICGYGINDLASARTVAQLQADIANIRETLATLPFYGTTISPHTASTDNWATTGANQTTAAGNVQAGTFNAALRAATPVGWAQVLDSDQYQEFGAPGAPSGQWNAPNYTTDGLHANAHGNQQIVYTFSSQPTYAPAVALTAANSNPSLWLEGDVGVTSSGGLVTAWQDQSANALVCTASGALRPGLSTNINGLQCISLNGSTALTIPTAAFLGAKTVVIVCKNGTTSFVEMIPLVLKDSGSTHSEPLQFIIFTGYKKICFQDDETASAAASVGYDVTLDTAAHAYIHSYVGGGNTDPTKYFSTYDGVGQVPLATGTTNQAAANLGAIGGRLTSGLALSNGYIGDIAFIAVWNRILTAAERAGLKLTLAKWGVS